MATGEIRVPTETDILKSVVAICAVRDDEDMVRKAIDRELSALPESLHASYLKVVLRVVVAQIFAGAAGKLDRELGQPWTDLALFVQAAANEAAEGGE